MLQTCTHKHRHRKQQACDPLLYVIVLGLFTIPFGCEYQMVPGKVIGPINVMR